MTSAIVVPAWNEESTISDVVASVRRLGTVVVVDDGSEDRTAERAGAAGADVVVHQVNEGYDRAVASGLRRGCELGASVLATVDADGEQALDSVGEALSTVASGRAVVALGVRPAPARVSERLFSAYTQRRFGVPDILCGVKVYAAAFVTEHDRLLDANTIGTGLALAALREGRPFVTFPVPIRPRRDSRFGTGMSANLRIAAAMSDALWRDFQSNLWQEGAGRTGNTS